MGGVVVVMVIRAFLFAPLFAHSLGGHPPSKRRVAPDASLVCSEAGTHLQRLTTAFGASNENVALVAPANPSSVIPGGRPHGGGGGGGCGRAAVTDGIGNL